MASDYKLGKYESDEWMVGRLKEYGVCAEYYGERNFCWSAQKIHCRCSYLAAHPDLLDRLNYGVRIK